MWATSRRRDGGAGEVIEDLDIDYIHHPAPFTTHLSIHLILQILNPFIFRIFIKAHQAVNDTLGVNSITRLATVCIKVWSWLVSSTMPYSRYIVRWSFEYFPGRRWLVGWSNRITFELCSIIRLIIQRTFSPLNTVVFFITSSPLKSILPRNPRRKGFVHPSHDRAHTGEAIPSGLFSSLKNSLFSCGR